MRVLILNWRDVASPRGGGAERVTHEVARRLVDRGHEITWLSSAAPGLPPSEQRDGVTILRRGSELTTRLHARRVAAAGFDVIVEGINTLPYLAPVWSSAPVVLLIHQLARNVWWYEAPLPLAAVGWLAEPLYLQAYRRTPVITVSASTRDDLRRLGLRGRIDVVPLAAGGGAAREVAVAKRLDGRLVAIGRLTPSKRFDHAIDAVRHLRATHPAAHLDIVGVGAEHDRLARQIARAGLDGAVVLRGRIGDAERDALLAAADAVVGTSVREGWGLTVTEAARLGTPAVVYDIPGFRDSVVDGRTGIVTAPDPDALAAGVRELIRDPAAYEAMRTAARERASTLTWEATTDAFESAVQAAAAQFRARSRATA